MTKSFCGSVAYLAPEMLEKQGHGFTLDWYLLGVLTYELINGLPPFYCKNQSQLFNNILKGELTFSRVFSNRAQTFIKDVRALPSSSAPPELLLSGYPGLYSEVGQHLRPCCRRRD